MYILHYKIFAQISDQYSGGKKKQNKTTSLKRLVGNESFKKQLYKYILGGWFIF